MTAGPGLARQGLRWAATHGMLRTAVRRRARAGNVDAALLLDTARQQRPHPTYHRMRSEYPFADGAYPGSLVTVHHDVARALLSGSDFAMLDRRGSLPAPVKLALAVAGPRPGPGPLDPPSMLAVDGEPHRRYRRLVSRTFSARAVARLRTQAEEIAAGLLDTLEAEARGGPVDLVASYASRLPVEMICSILGVHRSMLPSLLRWGEGVAIALDAGLSWSAFRRVEADLAALHEWLGRHIAQVRADPGDDLLSRLATARDAEDGAMLDETELAATAMLVLAAGFETTVTLLAGGTSVLLAHPDQRAVLAAEPSRWPNAVEELLRVEPPVTRGARRALRDTEMCGREVCAGQMVVPNISAANRDPEVFAGPDIVDATRGNAREHLAFSIGSHHCIGSGLARMEGEVGLRALFDRFPTLTAAGPATMRPTRLLRGYASLPVRLLS